MANVDCFERMCLMNVVWETGQYQLPGCPCRLAPTYPDFK